MNSQVCSTLLDYDGLAAVFDRFLPLIEPVGSAVLAHLPELPAGARVLDVACGTGEPGLSLARRSPGIHLLGVDAALGMIEVARAKAKRDNLANARFEVMTAETLSLADASQDAVLSRFGLLMFGDVTASAHQLARVLREGGHFSVAVWDSASVNTLVNSTVAALRPLVAAELLGPFDSFSLGDAGKQLLEAGLTRTKSGLFSWNYQFPSPEALWEFISGPGIFGRQFASLGEGEKEQVRLEVGASLAAYKGEDGSYRIPHTCRLWWGQR